MEKVLENVVDYGNTILDNLEKELKKDANTTAKKVKALTNDLEEVIETYNTEGFLEAAKMTLDVTLENLLKYGLTWKVGTSVVDVKKAFQEQGIEGGVEQLITEGIQQLVYTSKSLTTAVSTALKIRKAFTEKGTKEGILVAFKEGLQETLENSPVSSIYKTAVSKLTEAYNSVKDFITGTEKTLEKMNWKELVEYWNNMYKSGNLEEMEKSATLLQDILPRVENKKDKDPIIQIMMNQKLMEAKVDWWTSRLQNDQEGMEISSSQGSLCRKAGATIKTEEITFIDVAYRQILNSIKEAYNSNQQGESPLEQPTQLEQIEQLSQEQSLESQITNSFIINENLFDTNKNIINITKENINENISTNFKISDFISGKTQQRIDSNENIKIYLNQELIQKLEQLRNNLISENQNSNIEIQINSGFRTEEDNKELNNAHSNSHSNGKGVDITVWKETDGLTELVEPGKVSELAKQVGFTGVGTYKEFTHLDLRDKNYYWNK